MKVLHLCYSNDGGGAARAAFRIHTGLCQAGVDSTFMVSVRYGDNKSVITAGGKWRSLASIILPTLNKNIVRLQKSNNPIIHSLGVFPTGLHRLINNSDADLVNLHWVCGEMLSIAEIGKITKPIVWTLHDSWMFCGAEHHPGADDCGRYRKGYRKDNRPVGNSGFDLDRWTWRRKMHYWKKQPFNIICPSQWLAQCAKSSMLLEGENVVSIPNGIDSNLYRKINKKQARNLLNIQCGEKQLILVGGVSVTSDKNKGFYLLQQALEHLAEMGGREQYEVLVFGASRPIDTRCEQGFKYHYLGQVHDDLTLAITYSAADIYVAPSLIENLPNTVMESMACGTPCIAFDVGGISDLIRHKQNGYLAVPYETRDLAHGIQWVLQDGVQYRMLSKSARTNIECHFSLPVVVKQYQCFYQDVLAKPRKDTNGC